MNYLLIFEDGEIKQTEIAPTDSELESIEAGVLSVIQFNRETGKYEDLGSSGVWLEL